MAFLADDHMVVERDAQQAARFGNTVGDGNVGAAGLGGAGRVVVDHDHGRCAKVERPFHHFARMDCRFVERAFGEDFIGDQPVFVSR